jgi:hypothetical protein
VSTDPDSLYEYILFLTHDVNYPAIALRKWLIILLFKKIDMKSITNDTSIVRESILGGWEELPYGSIWLKNIISIGQNNIG